MPLTDAKLRSAKADEKPYKISDSGGLYLLVKPNGSRLWRWKYRIAGKENHYAIGEYPAVELVERPVSVRLMTARPSYSFQAVCETLVRQDPA